MLRSAILLLAILIALALRFVSVPFEELAARYILYDDAFYYLKIAEHLATSGMSSFDGVNLTNGYHPLWAIVLACLFMIGAADQAPYVALLLCVAFHIGASMFVYLIGDLVFRRRSPGAFLSATLYGANPLMLLVVLNGLETALAAFLLCLLIWLVTRARSLAIGKRVPSRTISMAVIVGALTFLARLDWVIIVLPTYVVLAAAPFLAEGRVDRRWLAAGAVLGAVVAVFMVTNYMLFDTWLPISGQLKHDTTDEAGFLLAEWKGLARSAGALLWPLRVVLTEHGFILLSLAIVLILCALALAPKHSRDGPVGVLMLLLGPVHGIAYVLVQGGGPSYYFLPLGLSIAWAGGLLAASLTTRFSTLRRVPTFRVVWTGTALLAIAGIIAFPSLLQSSTRERQWRYLRFEAAEWLSTSVEPEARIGSWWAGTLGFYANRTVINLDGLVNDTRYQEHLREGTEWAYILKHKIRYLADYFPHDPLDEERPHSISDYSPRFRTIRELRGSGHDVRPVKYFPDPEVSAVQAAGFYILRIDSG